MASELIDSDMESQDGMAKLARTIRDKILIDEPVKEDGLIDQLERAAIEIDDLLGSSFGPRGMNKIIVNPVGDIFVTSDGKVILKEMDVLHPIVTTLKKLAESMDSSISISGLFRRSFSQRYHSLGVVVMSEGRRDVAG